MILEKFGEVAQIQSYNILKKQKKLWKSRVLTSKLIKKKKRTIHLKKKLLLLPTLMRHFKIVYFWWSSVVRPPWPSNFFVHSTSQFPSVVECAAFGRFTRAQLPSTASLRSEKVIFGGKKFKNSRKKLIAYT